jgi:hypothetical protein
MPYWQNDGVCPALHQGGLEMSMRGCLRLLCQSVAIAGIVLGVVGQARATPAYTLDNTTGSGLGNPPFTLGSEFSTSVPIIVTGLGVFDDSQDGLVDSYPVGIWNGSGTLVASGTVASGTVDPLINQFRYTPASVLLAPGTYTIGALFLTGDDPLVFPGTAINFATASGITFIQNAFAAGGSLSDPTDSASTDPAYFGPNFTFETGQVPEPASLALLGAGLAALGLIRRRKRLSHSL